MKPRKIYCSACDREIDVLFTEEPHNLGGQAEVADAGVVCLEMGDRCTGGLCPVAAVSPDAMAVRVAKAGVRPEQHYNVRGMCDGCDREVNLMLTRGGYVTCPECGTTRRMVRT